MLQRGQSVRHVLRIAGSTIAIMIIAGCDGGGTEPDGGLTGTYALALTNGQTLPVVYYYSPLGGSTKWVVGGTLELSRQNRAVDSRRLREQSGGVGGVWDDFEYNTTASYERNGDQLVIQRPGFPGQTAYADTGLFDGDILHLPVKNIDGSGLHDGSRRAWTLTYVKR